MDIKASRIGDGPLVAPIIVQSVIVRLQIEVKPESKKKQEKSLLEKKKKKKKLIEY